MLTNGPCSTVLRCRRFTMRNETSVVNKLTLHLEIMLTRRLNLSAARGARSISYVGSIDQVLLISLIVAPPRWATVFAGNIFHPIYCVWWKAQQGHLIRYITMKWRIWNFCGVPFTLLSLLPSLLLNRWRSTSTLRTQGERHSMSSYHLLHRLQLVLTTV